VGVFLDVHSLTDEMRTLLDPHVKLPDRRNPDEIVERLADLSLDQLVQLTDAVFPLSATVADIKVCWPLGVPRLLVFLSRICLSLLTAPQAFVLALPAVAAVCNSTAALRVRDMEGLRMTRVLSDETRQLKQLKVRLSC
jgi:hypothetical protein